MTEIAEQISSPFIIVPFSANINFDFDKGMHQAALLTGNTTITFSNVKEGAFYTIAFQQDGVGNRLATWPAAAHFRGADGTLSVGANAIDIFWGIMRGGIGYIVAFKGFA